MLLAQKTSMWRGRYDLAFDGRPVSTWTSALWKSGGEFTLDGQPYQVRGNFWGSRFSMVDPLGNTVAAADRVGRKEWTVEAGGEVFTFRRASFWRSEQELHVGGVKAGTIRRTSMWRGDVEADLPGLPLPVQVFVVGVVIAMWEGEQTAAAVAAGG